MLTDKQVERLLQIALEHYDEHLQEGRDPMVVLDGVRTSVPIFSTRTFEEDGVLTLNRGITLRLEDYAGKSLGEYQIQIVRSA